MPAMPPGHRCCLLLALWLCAWPSAPARAQWAEQVLAARRAAAAAAATAQPTAAAEPQFVPRQLGVRLPACQATRVLRTPRGLPPAWPRLSAQQQAASAATPLLLQLTYAAWLDHPETKLGTCLSAMGVDVGTMEVVNARVPLGGTMTALLMRAGRRVFVVFRGTDIGDPGDVLVDSNCRHTEDVGRFFGARNTSVRLHSGFWAGWQALEPDVRAALERQLEAVQAETGEADDVKVAAAGGRRPPPTPVHFVGHSLGGALAAIAALRFNHLWRPRRTATVTGVHLFGCPRVGDAGWQEAYNKRLLSRTLRMSNHADFAVRLPMRLQPCPPASPLALPGVHAFRHVGRSVLLCPNAVTGLVEPRVDASGTSEVLDCSRIGGDAPDMTVSTHWLGSYMDAWRRAVAGAGNDLADDERLASVMCDECALTYLDRDQQLNVPARAGGPVACGVSSSCNRLPAWRAATAVGTMALKSYSPLSTCVTYVCT